MAWFLVARLLFVAAIGYSAHQLAPLPGGPIVNTLFGVTMGGEGVSQVVARRLSRDVEGPAQPYVRRALAFLKSRQNEDGGWGETCDSYADPSLAGRGPSTPSQTAWALLALLAGEDVLSPEAVRGVDYLTRGQQEVHMMPAVATRIHAVGQLGKHQPVRP